MHVYTVHMMRIEREVWIKHPSDFTPRSKVQTRAAAGPYTMLQGLLASQIGLIIPWEVSFSNDVNTTVRVYTPLIA